MKNQRFKQLRESVEDKLQVLCSKQHTSSKNREFVEEHLKGLFVIKNDTRWNSLYNSLYRLGIYMTKYPDGLSKVMEKFGVSVFRHQEVVYVREYVKVMGPIVEALDILQGEKNVGMGYLLPTITILKQKLEDFKENASIFECKPLIKGLISNINNR